jgi:hypothetical protein
MQMTTQTLEQLDAALAQLPATPVTDADLDARATLMARRITLYQAAKATAEANRRPKLQGNLVVNIPASVGSTQLYGKNGRVAHPRVIEGGRIVIDLFIDEFKSLLMHRECGLAWHNANHELLQRLGEMA